MSVVPPLTDTLANAVVFPTAEFNVVVPVLVTVMLPGPSTVPVNMVLAEPSLIVRPVVSAVVPLIVTALFVVVNVAVLVATEMLL
jgi:hypothetical protein